MGVSRSNMLCRLAGLAILFASVAVAQRNRTNNGDFVQFAMAGLIDRAGAWDELYPVPMPGSIHNAGDFRDSTTKPAAEKIAAAHGIDFVPYHFILPPPAALLFWPLGFFDPATAYQVWLLVSIFAAWTAAMQAGAVLRRCADHESRWSGFITLLICAMPPTRRAIMVANLTPIISAAIGWALLSLMDAQADVPAAAATVLGMFTKYATAALMPVVLVQRRWRAVAWAGALSVMWCVGTLLLIGPGPFKEFITVIAPTLGRSHEMADNICLYGVLLHALHQRPPLPLELTTVLSLLRILVLGLILLPMLRLGRDRMREPQAVCAAAISLLAWLLFFSPIAWSHYLIYLCPLWGWLACPLPQSRLRWMTAWLAMGLIVFSPDQMPPPSIDPWGLHLMASLGLMLALGMSGLSELCRQPTANPARGYHDAPLRRTPLPPAVSGLLPSSSPRYA